LLGRAFGPVGRSARATGLGEHLRHLLHGRWHTHVLHEVLRAGQHQVAAARSVERDLQRRREGRLHEPGRAVYLVPSGRVQRERRHGRIAVHPRSARLQRDDVCMGNRR
jgi:hypothetical protein